MTGIAVRPEYWSFVGMPADRGVSREARELRERLEETIDDLFENEALGEPRRKALLALDEVCMECSQENWDGYGAKAVSQATRHRARRFIQTLPTTIPIPEISVEPDGDVAFEWHRAPDNVFSVSVGNSDELSYAGLFGRNKAYGTECLEDELSETIIAHLRRLLSR